MLSWCSKEINEVSCVQRPPGTRLCPRVRHRSSYLAIYQDSDLHHLVVCAKHITKAQQLSLLLLAGIEIDWSSSQILKSVCACQEQVIRLYAVVDHEQFYSLTSTHLQPMLDLPLPYFFRHCAVTDRGPDTIF